MCSVVDVGRNLRFQKSQTQIQFSKILFADIIILVLLNMKFSIRLTKLMT